jgi:hypothetical protein
MGELVALKEGSGRAESLRRALDLLEVFLSHNSELGLAQLAKATQMNRTTAHRLLTTPSRSRMKETSSAYRRGGGGAVDSRTINSP